MCRWLRRIGEFAPLCYSIAALAAEITSLAWSTGLDLTLANNQGHTALHKAAYKGHGGLCRWLIANTALGCSQDAAKEPEEPIVDICAEAPEWPANHIAPECSLCDRSKDLVCCVGYRRDAGGYTPAMIAREQRHEAFAALSEARAPPPPPRRPAKGSRLQVLDGDGEEPVWRDEVGTVMAIAAVGRSTSGPRTAAGGLYG